MTLLAIILATFVSEDVTCITAGLLVASGQLTLAQGLLGCYLGLVIGDIGLWLLGRGAGLGLARLTWVRRRIPRHRLSDLTSAFDRNTFKVVLAARCVPGLRFPVYVGAGALGRSGWRFLLASTLACAIWVPLLVGLVSWAGEPAAAAMRQLLGSLWLAVAALALIGFVLVRATMLIFVSRQRAQLIASISRIWRWEFWPVWLFYLPLVPWILYLAIRYRGLTLPTATNPAIPHGGFVGESKWDILRRLPPEWVVSTALLPPDNAARRAERLSAIMEERGWGFPMILKPDAAERGAGLRLIRTANQAREYLESVSVAVLAQEYHPGPCEAGVFYYRVPGQQRGRIYSITDKQFPVLVGDGLQTVEDLIWFHPRYRMQAARFLARLNGQADQVLAAGETLRLAVAGNHCQGTCFRDGAHLWTPTLDAAIDAIARHFEGFYYGRFDVRYADAAQFRAGRGFKIVELNGATSESTNIYDPDWSIWRAWAVLAGQLRLAYAIGAANRKAGHRATSVSVLCRAIRAGLRDRGVPQASD